MRFGQNLSLQSQENFSKIQEQMSLFSTPKRFEDMNVRSSAKVPKILPSAATASADGPRL